MSSTTRCEPGLRWVIVAAGMALALAGTVAGCGTGSPASATSNPTTATLATTAPSASRTTPPPATAPPAGGHPLPVAAQSDAAMHAAGNNGPSSSILVPASCTVNGSTATATATGTYRGGFAPEVYARYGDVVDLYVFGPPRSGYPAGVQVAIPFSAGAPAIGGKGSWSVTVPLDRSLVRFDPPARCVVAAQPTHDFQGAPSAY